jgi:hypothetical protein
MTWPRFSQLATGWLPSVGVAVRVVQRTASSGADSPLLLC